MLCRMCVLVMCLVLLGNSKALQALGANAAIFIAAQLHQNYKPFINHRLNMLESYSLIASVLYVSYCRL